MSPKAFSTSQYDDPTPDQHYQCQGCYAWVPTNHQCEAREVTAWMSWRSILVALSVMLITILMILGVLWVAFSPNAARGATPKPVAAPESLLRARAACPNTASLVECRSALRRAYAAVSWQRAENLKLAREMVGNVSAWSCIHQGEGAWNATGGTYWGGLQMDRTFMRSYGKDMIRRHHAWADKWTPREQIIVAQRAFIQGRGYAPWPATSHACGLR